MSPHADGVWLFITCGLAAGSLLRASPRVTLTEPHIEISHLLQLLLWPNLFNQWETWWFCTWYLISYKAHKCIYIYVYTALKAHLFLDLCLGEDACSFCWSYLICSVHTFASLIPLYGLLNQRKKEKIGWDLLLVSQTVYL